MNKFIIAGITIYAASMVVALIMYKQFLNDLKEIGSTI